MKYINIITQQITSKLPKIPNTFNTTWDNSREYYINEGWRLLIEAEIPEGHAITSRTYIDNTDDTVTEIVETDTIENINTKQEEERINNLLTDFGEKVSILSTLLGLFDIQPPTTQSEASPIIYEKAKADSSLLADALLTLIVYQDLKTHKSDAEIYEIYQIINPIPIVE